MDKPMNIDETITAQLERIESKLDLVLERLKWAPQDMAEWYAEITQGGQETNQEPPPSGQG